ncbi:MAG: hypothetical protein AAGK00_01120, partial [Pseudomonadota bacterium]
VEHILTNVDANRHQFAKVSLCHATSPCCRNRQSLARWVKQPVHPITYLADDELDVAAGADTNTTAQQADRTNNNGRDEGVRDSACDHLLLDIGK